MSKTSSTGPLLLWLAFLVLFAHKGSADCGSASNFTASTINNAADATTLASACPTFFGDIVIAINSTGDINLDGLLNVTGNLEFAGDQYGGNQSDYTGPQITSFHSKSLTSIGGQLAVFSAPLIKDVSFPSLQSVISSIYIGALPLLMTIDLSSMQSFGVWVRIFDALNLTDLKFPVNANGGLTTNGIGITETGLEDLSGFTSTPGGVYFQQNYFLREVMIDVSETVFSGPNDQSLDGIGAIVVTNNSAAVNISLPNLSSTKGYIQLDNCSALSIPRLYSINGSFTMQNASFESLEAPNLGVIDGTLNITGSFTGISAFPALSRVTGDVYIQSSKYIDCSPFEQLSADSKIGGNVFFCQGASSSSTGLPSAAPSSSESTSSSSPSLSKGAKVGIGVGVTLSVLLISSGVLALYFRKRRHTRSSTPVVDPTSDRAEVAAPTPSKVHVLNEVEGNYPQRKATGTQELPG